MRFIQYEFPESNPFYGVTIDEALNDAVLVSYWMSDVVYVGRRCVLKDNVNVAYCEAQGIPVMRGLFGGRAYLYEKGKHLTLSIYKNGVTEAQIQNILKNVLADVGIVTTIIGNDIRYGNSRVGMTSPSNFNMTAGDLVLDVDFDKAEKCLTFPYEKWKGKPVSNIRDWIKPLNTITLVSFTDIVDKLRVQSENILETQLTLDNLTTDELETMKKLLPKYTSEEWIKYGRWCPVRSICNEC